MSEPDPFTQYVDNWDATAVKIQELQNQKKALTAAIDKQLTALSETEMTMRKSITESVVKALGDKAKEGVNHYFLPDGRKLKLTVAKTRTIDVAQIPAAREAWAGLNDHSAIAFDEVFRVKHELDKAKWNKTTDGEKLAVSRAITVKDAAPTLVFD